MTGTSPPHAGVLRPPAQVMRLDRLGALRPCRLSFARHLLRRIETGGWRVVRRHRVVDGDGCGRAVHVVETGQRSYGLVAAWDAGEIAFALCDGEPGADDLARIAAALAQPGAARLTERELCFARARRHGTLWPHAVARLAAGQQPEATQVTAAGALVQAGTPLASGKAGTADRDLIADRPELHAPFQAELLMFWLARGLARDLLEEDARQSGGARAVALDAGLAETLGLGLTVGLGLAAFPVRHPCLFNTWIMAREQAIARVVALDRVTAADRDRVADRLGDGALGRLVAGMELTGTRRRPWAELMQRTGESLGEGMQEALASAMLEPYGALIDGLSHCMSDTLDRDYRIDGSLPVGRVRELIAGVHGWALERDWSAVSMTALAWSMTGDEADPRLQRRETRATGPFELPLAVVHDAVRAWHVLGGYADEVPVAQVLLEHPEHRSAIRRAQITGFAPYAEIRANLIDAEMRPVLLMRAMLAFMGAEAVALPNDRQMGARFFAGSPCPVPVAGAA